ncbi:MAG TPA: DsbC family protein [Nitrosomonas mobilis]|nr:DsbC family protein [Nitrosomonas mobilis]
MSLLLRLFVPFTLIGLLISGFAIAGESDLRKTLQTHFPDSEIESLTQTPYQGLYEVVIGGEVFYTDEKADYFFMGHMVDTKTRTSLTSERVQQIRDARRIPIDSLPLQHALKTVKGKGERSLIVYSDPNCPYCKKLEEKLVKAENVTIRTLVYPILNGSMDTAVAIWCSPDRVKAWDDFMLRAIKPKAGECETPLMTILQSGQEYRITGTPTLIFADGSIVSGLIPLAEIEKRLDQQSAKSK